MKSYDYAHREGVDRVTWQRFHALSKSMAERIAGLNAEMILGIARAGLFPATVIACALRIELFPIRLSRRQSDVVKHVSPQWHVPVPGAIAGKRVVIVDEMADTGETMRIASEAARVQGAAELLTASLFAHSWAQPMPDVVGEVSDALVVFPWDAEVLIDGEWRIHPELEAFVRPKDARGTG